MIIKIFLTLLTILAVTAEACALDVNFLTQAEVAASEITLGDIAEFSEKSQLSEALSTIIICRSPEPGEVTGLDARQVITSLLKEHGPMNAVFWKGSSGISVKRLSQTITHNQVIAVIKQYIDDNLHRLPKAKIAFKPDSLPLPFLLPTGRLSWEVIPSSPRIIGSSRFAVIIRVDGRVEKNFSVRGHTEAIMPVVVTARRLKYGEIVTADSIALAPRDISRFESYIDTPGLVVGSLIKRTLNEGAVVDIEAIEQPPVVQRGELVKIVISHNGLLLTANGIARTDGRKDEIIKVKNTSSNKLVYCRVHAPGIVEVKL